MKRTSQAGRCALSLLIAVVACFGAPAAWSAVTSQTKTVATTVTPSGGWTTPDNANQIDGSCASGDGMSANALTITGWGFTIPPGSTILGIEVHSKSAYNASSN